MAITVHHTKRGVSIRASGKDAMGLFEAITRRGPDEQVAEWNATVSIGQEVDYLGYPDAAPQRFKTRSAAEVLSGHTAVVWLEGKSGCVTLDACRPCSVALGGG